MTSLRRPLFLGGRRPRAGIYWELSLYFCSFLLIVRRVKLHRADAYRRAALAELTGLIDESATDANNETKLREAAEILKRTALAGAPRVDVAKLSGRPWIEWLNTHGTGVVFRGAVARLLEQRVYQGAASDVSEEDLHEAVKAIRAWIAHHRIDPRDPGET